MINSQLVLHTSTEDSQPFVVVGRGGSDFQARFQRADGSGEGSRESAAAQGHASQEIRPQRANQMCVMLALACVFAALMLRGMRLSRHALGRSRHDLHERWQASCAMGRRRGEPCLAWLLALTESDVACVLCVLCAETRNGESARNGGYWQRQLARQQKEAKDGLIAQRFCSSLSRDRAWQCAHAHAICHASCISCGCLLSDSKRIANSRWARCHSPFQVAESTSL